MIKTLQKEIEKLIKELDLRCSVEDFKDKVNWHYISQHQKLSEEFIRYFKNRVDWLYISSCQTLSEDFIREFKEVFGKVSWVYISEYQKLSEDFIKEFKDQVDWDYISSAQKLSEDFIREFKDKVFWDCIPQFQKISDKFVEEFKNKISEEDIKTIKEINRKTTTEEKISEMKEYAEKYNLKFDGKYLYAFRNHDEYGRGAYNKTLTYSQGKYYRDWHLDMRRDEQNSFGLGIWPSGNTHVKVKVEDWGIYIGREDGKCRVWGFEVI